MSAAVSAAPGRRAARALLLVAVTLVAACGGAPAPSPATPWEVDPTDTPRSGSLHQLRSAERVPSLEAPGTVVTRALDVAREAAFGDESEAAEGPAYAEAQNAHRDGLTEAWLRVDTAVVLARVEAAPSPAPRPVSVERQSRARAGRVPPGELHLRVAGHGDVKVRVFDNDGRMRAEAILEISSALRDRRLDVVRTMEPRLVAMLYLVGQRYDAPLVVVSGYRQRGVTATEGSRHGAGNACDFYIEGVGVRALARTLEGMFANVGVGYYPRSGFVHLDSRRRTYYWIDNSGPGQRSRTRTRSIEVTANPADDVTLRSMHVTEQEIYIPPP